MSDVEDRARDVVLFRDRVASVAVALALAYGFGCAAAGFADALLKESRIQTVAGVLIGLAVLVVLVPVRRGALRWRAGQVLILLVLPVWGFLIDMNLPSCRAPCQSDYRLLAFPEIDGLYAGYALTVLAYWVSRVRPEALRPRAEALLVATLGFGIALMVPVIVHFHLLPLLGILFAPMGLPLAAPHGVVVLFGVELARRMRRRGEEEAARRTAARKAFALGSPLLLGLYAVVHAAVLRDPGGALRVFWRTCGNGLFSQLSSAVCHGDHYLCTVAAKGHPWLVRPERFGARRGRTILVNRQLAIANAFEDLLIERVPRFARLARRVYDQLGLPVSRLVRSRWIADAIFLAMKPLEWAFYVTLLLADRSSPEERIGRMYAPGPASTGARSPARLAIGPDGAL